MHTGTLISELMAVVERVGQAAGQQQTASQQELHEIFAMQIALTEGERVFMGAA